MKNALPDPTTHMKRYEILIALSIAAGVLSFEVAAAAYVWSYEIAAVVTAAVATAAVVTTAVAAIVYRTSDDDLGWSIAILGWVVFTDLMIGGVAMDPTMPPVYMKSFVLFNVFMVTNISVGLLAAVCTCGSVEDDKDDDVVVAVAVEMN